jgi:hypothetical protein
VIAPVPANEEDPWCSKQAALLRPGGESVSKRCALSLHRTAIKSGEFWQHAREFYLGTPGGNSAC